MNETQNRQQVIDEEHLRLLSIFHYISGGFTLFISLIFLFQFFMFSIIFDEIMMEMSDFTLIAYYNLIRKYFLF